MNDTITATTTTDREEADRVAQIRGYELANRARIIRDTTAKEEIWRVPREPGSKYHYRVCLSGETPKCTCPDFAETWRPCCHIYATQMVRQFPGVSIPAPQYPKEVPPGSPPWVTPELIEETLRYWQVYYPERLAPDDALLIITSLCLLYDVARN